MCPVHLLSFVKTRLYGKYLWQKMIFWRILRAKWTKLQSQLILRKDPPPFITVAVSDKQCRSHTVGFKITIALQFFFLI